MNIYNKIIVFFILISLRTTINSQIILIEGSPRSGKTTVARMLNEKLSTSKLFSVDEYVDVFNPEYSQEEKMYNLMYENICEDKTVIHDTNEYLEHCQNIFSSIKIFSVILFCTPFELLKRTVIENKRAIETGEDFERDVRAVVRYFTNRYECTSTKSERSLCSFRSGRLFNKIRELVLNSAETIEVRDSIRIFAGWESLSFRNISHRDSSLFIQSISNEANLIINTEEYSAIECADIINIGYQNWLEGTGPRNTEIFN